MAGNLGIGYHDSKRKTFGKWEYPAKEVKVEAASWPDYVFEEGHKVGTLEALESYIKTKKHLPEIPTAKQMVDNGINLGELNIRLLQKVEELTLHLIEKDKQLNNEKATNEKQQQEIDMVIKELVSIKKKIKP